MADSPTAASLRFRPADAAPGRPRAPDPATAPHREAALAWLTRELPVSGEPGLASVREAVGDVLRLEVLKTRDAGPLAAAAGSYEPEIHGHGPTRIDVAIAVTGSLGIVDVVVCVCFVNGPGRRPSVLHERSRPRPMSTPLPPSTLAELELERLSAAICRAPDDDAPRAQLAAWWTARGEPRGAFIHAQLVGDEIMARHLLAQHGRDWTDGLPVAPRDRVYRRGFLSEARVACSPYDFQQSFANPAWNLLTTVHLDVHDEPYQAEFMTVAGLASLRRLSGLNPRTLELTALPPGVTHAHFRAGVHECPPNLDTLELEPFRFYDLWVFGRQQKHPHLASLSVTAYSDLEGPDVLVVQGLLAEPRPARVVLAVVRHGDPIWRLEATGDAWDFTGDERVLQQIRDVADDELL